MDSIAASVVGDIRDFRVACICWNQMRENSCNGSRVSTPRQPRSTTLLSCGWAKELNSNCSCADASKSSREPLRESESEPLALRALPQSTVLEVLA